MFDVGRREYVESARDGGVVKLSRELDIDVRPLEAYSALRGDYSFLLESADKEVSAFRQVTSDGARMPGARYSFVGYDPEAVVRIRDRRVEVEELNGGSVEFSSEVVDDGVIRGGSDALDALRDAFPDVEPVNFADGDRQVFMGGFVGYIAYDAVHDLWLREVDAGDGERVVDDAAFVVSTRNLVFDHHDDTVELVYTPLPGGDPEAQYRRAERDAEEAVEKLRGYEDREMGSFEVLEERSGSRTDYLDAVGRAREHILDGDIYQAVLSTKKELRVRGDVRDFYSELRRINPSPYMYLLEFDDYSVVGSSPETLLSVHGDRVSTNPIAGTCPRGETAVEDRRLAGEMLSDEKELSEHVMLVDLGRNDVRRVAESGSIEVEDFMSVVQYSHVQHIESTVSGTLRTDGRRLDAFDATRSIFPAGTLSGAPKIRAMEIIDDLEPEPRGAYGGGVGYYSWNGDSDFAITIRTASFRDRGDHKEMSVQAGAGIVADSEPESEWEECRDKMDALLAALEGLRRESGVVE